MAKNKKKRKPSKSNDFKKPNAEDYKRGKLAIYVTAGITVTVVVGLFFLYSAK